MRTCQNQMTRRNSLNMVTERKNHEKKHTALTKLLRHIPTFTNIYKENLLLKQERDRDRDSLKEGDRGKERDKENDKQKDNEK